jgi:flagellar protein FlaI
MENKNELDGIPIESDTIDPSVFEKGEVEEEKKVNDYATIKILEYSNEYYYKVEEPELTEFEKLILKETKSKLIDSLKYEDLDEYEADTMEETVRNLAKNIIKNYISPGSAFTNKLKSLFGRDTGEDVTQDKIDRILYYVVRDLVYYGKVTPIMDDDKIEDISCDAPNLPIFVYHSDYRDVMTNVAFEENELDAFIRTLSQLSGKHISRSDPRVDGSLPDGSRVQLTLGEEVTSDGSNFTIRKFDEIPFTPVDLVRLGTFSLEQMAYLWLCIENNKSLIFAGGTASGKTTSMNAVSLFIPPGSKTITIEDTREITLRHNNWIKSVTRDSFGGEDKGEVGMYKLLRDALRQRPEYIIVGEIRGEEAQTLFQAMSTGHTTYSTMHADSVGSAINRLENPPINVARMMLQSLDIICVQNQAFVNDERVRRNESITELLGIDTDTRNIRTEPVFEWDSMTDTFNKTGDSKALADIKQTRAWSDRELEEALEKRRRLLNEMVEQGINDYKVVTDIIRAFILDNECVMRELENGNLVEVADDYEKVQKLLEEAAEKSGEIDVEEIKEGDKDE